MHFIGENWEMIKQTIHTEYDLTNISYNTWIEPLQFYDVKDDTVGRVGINNGLSTSFPHFVDNVM